MNVPSRQRSQINNDSQQIYCSFFCMHQASFVNKEVFINICPSRQDIKPVMALNVNVLAHVQESCQSSYLMPNKNTQGMFSLRHFSLT